MDTVQYSQIHLVDLQTNKRTIVHIGTTVGRSESEVIVTDGAHPPVTLHFGQVNARLYGSSILLKSFVGEGVVMRVDDKEVTSSAPILHGSAMTIDGYEYRCELYKWGALPPAARLFPTWLTTTGPVRDHNEDAIGVYQHPKGNLFALADGVGGAESGELISEFAVKYLLNTFHRNLRYEVDWIEVLRRTYEEINAEVRRFSFMSAASAGSTLTTVVIQGWDAYVCHIGDTRLYHWTGSSLRQITEEHATFSDHKPLESEHGHQPSKRNVLVKGIGKSDTIEPDTLTIRLQPGDKLILCSDGVYDRLQLDEVAEYISSMSLRQVPAHMIQIANERFNSDNASVISIDVKGDIKKQREEEKPAPQDRVFVGYNSRWKMTLHAQEELRTRYQFRSRRARIFKVFSLVFMGLVLCALILLRIVLLQDSGAGSSAGAFDVLGLQPATPTALLVNTPTRSVLVTVTTLPSPAPSLTPSETPVPPTITLMPAPSSTLSRGGAN
jgi:PPM family protein phosphatase